MTAETIIQSLAPSVIARSQRFPPSAGPMINSATKESILSFHGSVDCLAEPVTGRRLAPTRWLAMTSVHSNASDLEQRR